MKNESSGSSAGRVRRVRADDPRVAGLVEWLCKQGWSAEAQTKVLEATLDAASKEGVLQVGPEDEVR